MLDSNIKQIDVMISSLFGRMSINEINNYVHSYWRDKLPYHLIKSMFYLYLSSITFNITKDIYHYANLRYSLREIIEIIKNKYPSLDVNYQIYIIRFSCL